MEDHDRAPGRVVEASVVVPTHRGVHRLPVLLQALEAQDFAGPWEVLVVVDGVLDTTLDLLHAYSGRLTLRSVVMGEPVGVCGALNDGFAAARGRVLIRCDDDLTPGPSMVSRHVAHHAGPELRGVIGPTRDVFPDTPYARAYGRAANRKALAAAYLRDPGDRWLHWAAHNSLTREAWDLAGGFDARFVYGQDSELGWRLSQAGVALNIDPQLEIEHRGPTVSAKDRVPRAFVAGASRRLFVSVHPEVRYPRSPATTARDHVWQAGVATVARLVRGREGYRRVGRSIDVVLPVLPLSIGRHLVAFVVEAAGRSGAVNGPDNLVDLKGQKSAEVATELDQVLPPSS